jgi:hypothetical protein
MYSVEMRVDVGGADGIPHTFIVVTGPDGVERGYGFAPRDPGALAGDGKSGITRAMNIAKQLAKYRWIQTHI